MTERAKLIERLENAEAGSRELDAEIGSALGCKIYHNKQGILMYSPGDRTRRLPHYTTSLDAAVSLVERLLPGQEWSIGSNRPELGDPWARIRLSPLQSLQESGATPALALVLATLKSLDARDKPTI